MPGSLETGVGPPKGQAPRGPGVREWEDAVTVGIRVAIAPPSLGSFIGWPLVPALVACALLRARSTCNIAQLCGRVKEKSQTPEIPGVVDGRQ